MVVYVLKKIMTKIINKNKAVEIIDYFSQFPFSKVLSNNNKKSLVVHAGLLPSWSLSDTLSANEELTESLKSDPEEFFMTMYSDRSKAISKSTIFPKYGKKSNTYLVQE